jgi:hypothetical protein
MKRVEIAIIPADEEQSLLAEHINSVVWDEDLPTTGVTAISGFDEDDEADDDEGARDWPGLATYEIGGEDATIEVLGALMPGVETSSSMPLLVVERDHQNALAIGVGWRRIESADLDAGRRWYIAGTPPQVLLGLDDETAIVGAARVVPVNRLGPAQMMADRLSSATALSRPDTAQRVLRRLHTAENRRRALFEHCLMCRTYLPPEDMFDDRCLACMSKHFGLIVD